MGVKINIATRTVGVRTENERITMDSIKWLATEGGPLILVSVVSANHWREYQTIWPLTGDLATDEPRHEVAQPCTSRAASK
jgi:hypothetical protein